MSRMLAAKAALAIRVDALGEDTNVELGMEHRAMLEKRMRSLEEGKVGTPGVWAPLVSDSTAPGLCCLLTTLPLICLVIN